VTARVYLLFDLVNAEGAQVARKLQEQAGVVAVDVLEGPPDIVIVAEAAGRQELADYVMKILGLLDGVIDNVRVLPVRGT